MKPLKTISSDDPNINPHLLKIIAYRKSGLSLNHIIGCTLDCAYCVRHFYGNYEMKEPHLLCSNKEAVDRLINHPFFIPNKSPIQLFNRATDPFLKNVKPYTHDVLKIMDDLGYTNPILIITRAQVTENDVKQLESLKNLKISILVTYSGINNEKIEPISKTGITVESIKTISSFKNKIKLILYWRPIVIGWNDDEGSFNRVLQCGKLVDAIVYTGYYHRPENYQHLESLGIAVPYDDFARRKFLPLALERRIFEAYKDSGLEVPLFRKTSCGVTFAHKLPDYNGHWGINELCDICPQSQKNICSENYNAPTIEEFQKLLALYEYDTPFMIEDGHIWTQDLGEEKRYHLQHTLEYQVWDIEKPHFKDQHGRAPFGQMELEDNKTWYEGVKQSFLKNIKEDDD